MKKTTEAVRQPYFLNHNGKTTEEVFGRNPEEFMLNDSGSADNIPDDVFAFTLFSSLNSVFDDRSVALLSLILGGVYGESFDRKSELAEKLTNAITDSAERFKIIKGVAGALVSRDEDIEKKTAELRKKLEALQG